ncbi:MAG TPA: acyltransferase, partial [Pyrinomonadaceae bacterium]|nr:acyltransferase [Pyrinomonadaceae bacterium]
MAHLPTQSPRLRSIDALRGIAALGVVLYHAVEQGPKWLPNNLFDYPVRALQFVSSFGYIGVFLFFVISGFCIHLQWAKARATGVEPDIRFGPFWKRRLRRLYPPYVIALGLFLLITAIKSEVSLTHFFFYDLVMHLLMLHNL